VGCALLGVEHADGRTFAVTDPAARLAQGCMTSDDIYAEVLCTWYFPRAGEDRVGIQIAAPGEFSRRTSVSLKVRGNHAMATCRCPQTYVLPPWRRRWQPTHRYRPRLWH
jgi:hypothetical protein